MGQRTAIELTFTAINNTTYVQMDSIKIMNRTQSGVTVLVYPDTVLTVLWVGIPESSSTSDGFRLNQNYPNPVRDQTTVEISLPEQGQVNLMVSDMLGRTVYNRNMILTSGLHTLKFNPGKEAFYFLSATWQGFRKNIKILHYGPGDNQRCSLSYLGSSSLEPEWKSRTSEGGFMISPGDELLYVGYSSGMETGLLDSPEESATYTFQFATNIPCPGTTAVEYEGQVYNTIQIFNQCWLKENLNVGTMIPGGQEMLDNGVTEKYCYENNTENCTTYGGLYRWKEAMHYSEIIGAKGICPDGWHVPADEEWKLLEGAVDSQYGIGNTLWDDDGYSRGFDAGFNLKSQWGWGSGNGSDLFGFMGLPSGGCDVSGNFGTMGSIGAWWSSTVYFGILAAYRSLHIAYSGVGRSDYNIQYGLSVRCVRDY